MKKLFSLLMIPLLAFTAFSGVVTPVNAQFGADRTVFDGVDGGNTQGVSTPGTGIGTQDGFVNVVKGAINWVLGILALIALIILLWGGFQMVTAAGNEEQYKKGFTILKQAAIGLIMIGVAWFIVSIIFRLVNLTTSSANGPSGTSGG